MRLKTIPRVVDNDHDEITITFEGRELRGWSYRNEEERRKKIGFAHEYVEGFCDGFEYAATVPTA